MKCKHIWNDPHNYAVCEVCVRDKEIYKMRAQIDHLRGTLRIVNDYIKSDKNVPDNVFQAVDIAIRS